MSWTAHYFDRRLNRDCVTRTYSTREGALRSACDLSRDSCIVKYVVGPDDERIGPVDIEAWCKTHRTPQRPKDPK